MIESPALFPGQIALSTYQRLREEATALLNQHGFKANGQETKVTKIARKRVKRYGPRAV